MPTTAAPTAQPLLPLILLSPLKPAVPAPGGTIDLMVRVQAPARPEAPAVAHQPPKRLSLVVDRSGSMDGQPLAEALKCVRHIAAAMTAQDQLSVTVYDHEAQVLVPLAPVASVDAIHRVLDTVESGGSTDLFGGWQTGARQLEAGQEGAISRVILLSDGQANHGLLDLAAIEGHCHDWLARGVSTTTVGLGHGFNEDLMIAMARAGGGQQYYGQTAADLFDSFDEELSLLQALWLRQLRLKLIPAPGVIVEPLGVVDQDPDGRYQLSDLAWGAESWLALRLHLSPAAPGQERALLAVTLEGQPLQGAPLTVHAPMLSLPVLEQAALDALPQDEALLRRLQEADFAQRSLAVAHHVRAGNPAAARKLLAELDQRFAGHPWLQAKLQRLHDLADHDPEMMVKETRFASRRLAKRLVAHAESNFTIDETAYEMPAFLRRKSEEGRGRKPGH